MSGENMEEFKTNLDTAFKTNSELEMDGVWFSTTETTSFKCRRFGGVNTQKVRSASAKYFKPYSKQIDANALSDEKQRELTVKAFVEACLVDWRGVEVNGKELPFSIENAVKLLTALPALTDTLIKYTTEMDSYKEVLGNF
jgi:hypothetical protein